MITSRADEKGGSMRYLRKIVLLLTVSFMALSTSVSAWKKAGGVLRVNSEAAGNY
jgi:hypothetical protein